MTTAEAPSHASPQRWRVGFWPLCIALCGAPLSWFVQMNVSQALAAYACYPHQAPLNHLQWPHLQMIIALVSVICLAGSAASGVTAYQLWRRVRHEKAESGQVMEAGEGRTRFMTALALSFSLLFFIALMFTGCATIFVSPCQAMLAS